MKIGLNATCFNDRPSGAKQRFIGIYKALFERLKDDEFVVYEPLDCRIAAWFDAPDNVTFKQTPLSNHGRLQKFFGGFRYWPSELKREQFDIFEWFHLPLPKMGARKTLLTIHDIRGLYLSGNWRERTLYKLALEWSLKHADHVVTVSASVRDEVLGFYPETKISVIYNGIDIDFFKETTQMELREVRQRLGLPEQFLLAVGHFEKRKNYLNLIEAVARLHERGRPVHLVVIGNDSGERGEVEARMRARNLDGYVHIFSGLTDDEVRCVYALSELFVFPSSYEGFGIPVLEVMASGRPIVLSDTPVFREITQDHGEYFSLHDPDAIANAIDAVLSTPEIQHRLVQYGKGRVMDFGFESIARDLAALYRSIGCEGQ